VPHWQTHRNTLMEDDVSIDAPCHFCGRTDYPHECIRMPTILNSLYYCPDGKKHQFVERRWRRPVCERCDERQHRDAR